MAAEKRGIFGRLLQRAEESAEPEKGPLPVRKINVPEYAVQTKGPLPIPTRIKFRGMLDLDGLYKFMTLWLKKRKFEFHETLHKYKPPELQIRWVAERRKTGFAKEVIYVEFHMWGEYNIEVIKNGKKKNMSNVRMQLALGMGLEAPYADLFGKRRWNLPMERKLLHIFHKYVLRREFELLYIDVLYYEVYHFLADIKQYMKLEARGTAY